MKVNMANFSGRGSVIVKDPPPFWLAVVNQNWEAAENCLELKDVAYNYHPDNWRITPKATPIELAISHGKWDFVSKILNKFPTALAEGIVFNQDHGSGNYTKDSLPIKINPVDEDLILEILQNKNYSIRPYFVSRLLAEAAFGSGNPQWEFIKKILNYCSEDVLSSLLNLLWEFERRCRSQDLLSQFYQLVFDHAQEHHFPWLEHHLKDFFYISKHIPSIELTDKLLHFGDKGVSTVLGLFCNARDFFSSHLPHLKKKILELKTDFSKEEISILVQIGATYDESLMLEMFKRYPETDIENLFGGNTKDAQQLIKLAKEHPCVKKIIETNLHHLIEGCSDDLLLECDRVFFSIHGDALDLLKETLEMFPDCDISFYIDRMFEYTYGRMDQRIQQALGIIHQHATQRSDTVFLEKYGKKIEEHLPSPPKKRKL
jgi:hypothetical protein